MSNIPYGTLRGIAEELKNIRVILEKQSTTEQSSVVGEWIVRANGNNECSVCGREKQIGWVNFCGFCGAKMKG